MGFIDRLFNRKQRVTAEELARVLSHATAHFAFEGETSLLSSMKQVVDDNSEINVLELLLVAGFPLDILTTTRFKHRSHAIRSRFKGVLITVARSLVKPDRIDEVDWSELPDLIEARFLEYGQILEESAGPSGLQSYSMRASHYILGRPDPVAMMHIAAQFSLILKHMRQAVESYELVDQPTPDSSPPTPREGILQRRLREDLLSPESTDVDAQLDRIGREYGVPSDVLQRKFISYALTLKLGGQSSHWNDDVDEHGRSIGALTEEEIAVAHHDLQRAILNRVKIAVVSERGGVSGRTGRREYIEDDRSSARGSESFPDQIAIPGETPEVTIPYVSFEAADSVEELKKLYLTACAGAANLLVPIILEMAGGGVSLQVARGCAIDLVEEAHHKNIATSRDTRGLFVGARSLLETRWKEWSKRGDPATRMKLAYGED